MSEVPETEATMLAAYSEVRYSLAKTGLNDMPPVRLSTCKSAFYFQDYLSGDEARELADALRSIADTVDPAPEADAPSPAALRQAFGAAFVGGPGIVGKREGE